MARPENTARKSGPKRDPVTGRLSGGNPGNRGGGRPPDAFKAMCRSLASSAAVQKRVEDILANPDHPMFMSALRWASEHGYGKPSQPVAVSGPEGAPLTIRVVRE